MGKLFSLVLISLGGWFGTHAQDVEKDLLSPYLHKNKVTHAQSFFVGKQQISENKHALTVGGEYNFNTPFLLENLTPWVSMQFTSEVNSFFFGTGMRYELDIGTYDYARNTTAYIGMNLGVGFSTTINTNPHSIDFLVGGSYELEGKNISVNDLNVVLDQLYELGLPQVEEHLGSEYSDAVSAYRTGDGQEDREEASDFITPHLQNANNLSYTLQAPFRETLSVPVASALSLTKIQFGVSASFEHGYKFPFGNVGIRCSILPTNVFNSSTAYSFVSALVIQSKFPDLF